MDPNSQRCIFCGQQGALTGEHLWPKWMHDAWVPRCAAGNVQMQTRFARWSGALVIRPDLRASRQPHRNRELKVVCAGCNGGWMSDLEAAAKEVLQAMYADGLVALQSEQQHVLSRWAALRTVIFQYTIENRVAIPYRDRLMLAQGSGLPIEWKVWIGVNEAPVWKDGRMHQSVCALLPPGTSDDRLNSAFTLIGFARTMFYTERVPDLPVNRLALHKRLCLTQIWPIQSDPVSVPSLSIDDGVARSMVDTLSAEAVAIHGTRCGRTKQELSWK